MDETHETRFSQDKNIAAFYHSIAALKATNKPRLFYSKNHILIIQYPPQVVAEIALIKSALHQYIIDNYDYTIECE